VQRGEQVPLNGDAADQPGSASRLMLLMVISSALDVSTASITSSNVVTQRAIGKLMATPE
jgi:hypothetical protein